MSTDKVQGKVVVITGASSGLGETAARELTRRGAKVVLGARRIDRLEALSKELNLPQGSIVKTDVSKQADVEALVKAAADLHGQIDVLVNNAGAFFFEPFEQGKAENWETMIDVNVKGVLYGASAVIPYFKERKSGQIINVSSILGRRVLPAGFVYSSTKFAVRAISEGLRLELKPYNIRVMNVSPGATETEGFNSMPGSEALGHTAPATAFSDAIIYAIGQPDSVNVNDIIFQSSR